MFTNGSLRPLTKRVAIRVILWGRSKEKANNRVFESYLVLLAYERICYWHYLAPNDPVSGLVLKRFWDWTSYVTKGNFSVLPSFL